MSLLFGGISFLFSGVIMLLVIAFWIWMIVDAAKRKFKNDVEKILWIVVIVLGQIIGAVVYFIVIRLYNKKGLIKK